MTTSTKLNVLAVALLVGFASCLWAADAKKTPPAKDGQHSDGGAWGFKRITNAPKLPRILLIGDSIANGYHKKVAELLKGKANVDLWITPKTVAAKNIGDDLAKVLKNGPYRVVHFNEAGLHAWAKGRVPEGQYGPLMENYIKAMKEHAGSATLIWASSTPVTVKDKPGELNKEINATVVEHNEAAKKVVQEQKIAIDDLYALMIDKLKLARGDQWHWTKAGSDIQAAAVSKSILQAMGNEKNPKK